MKTIRTVNLGKNYGKEKFTALEDLNLDIPANSIFGFLGPNGAGKTTTIKLLTGLMTPSRGQVWIGDQMVSRTCRGIRRDIGYLGQGPRYYGWMTGTGLLRMVGSLFGLSGKEAASRADELLELTGLNPHKNRKVKTYSGGMVQRLGIAQALVGRPDVLFLDEPVSDMDPLGRREVLEFISRLKGRITVFMSTHILEDVERVCDTVGIIHNGRLIRLSETAALKQEFGEARVRFEFGESKDADACRDWLDTHLDSSAYTGTGNAFTLSLSDFTSVRSGFLHWTADHCLSFNRLQTVIPTLEDVFVKIIGGENEKADALSITA